MKNSMNVSPWMQASLSMPTYAQYQMSPGNLHITRKVLNHNISGKINPKPQVTQTPMAIIGFGQHQQSYSIIGLANWIVSTPESTS